MIATLLTFASGLFSSMPRKIIIFVIIAIILFGGGVTLGFKYSNTKWQAKEAKLLKDWAESMKKLDEEHRKREQELIAKNKKTRVQVREVVREVPKYITTDGCNIDDDGLQHIRTYVRKLFPEAK